MVVNVMIVFVVVVVVVMVVMVLMVVVMVVMVLMVVVMVLMVSLLLTLTFTLSSSRQLPLRPPPWISTLCIAIAHLDAKTNCRKLLLGRKFTLFDQAL